MELIYLKNLLGKSSLIQSSLIKYFRGNDTNAKWTGQVVEKYSSSFLSSREPDDSFKLKSFETCILIPDHVRDPGIFKK